MTSQYDTMLVSFDIKRGYVFVDLGSKAAVSAVVTQSRREGGIEFGEKKLNVEPSKKPVRPRGAAIPLAKTEHFSERT